MSADNLWQKIKIGDTVSFEVEINQNKVKDFVSLSGDTNLLHLNHEFAVKKGFSDQVAQGMLLASYFSRLVNEFLPDHNLYLSQSLNFKKPVLIAETVIVKGKIINKIESTQMLEIETTIINQHNEEAVKGLAKVKYI
ncbi:MaoC family dehydratase [Patescibacteria group bacterium]|nr:MaoC family dehydratase [Patescibacteria group bacterium]